MKRIHHLDPILFHRCQFPPRYRPIDEFWMALGFHRKPRYKMGQKWQCRTCKKIWVYTPGDAGHLLWRRVPAQRGKTSWDSSA
jgi:hypothetical protein